jgi:hypothetical protein
VEAQQWMNMPAKYKMAAEQLTNAPAKQSLALNRA